MDDVDGDIDAGVDVDVENTGVDNEYFFKAATAGNNGFSFILHVSELMCQTRCS